MGAKMKIWRAAQYALLGVAAVVIAFPFVWMVLTALKPESEIVTFPPSLLPKHWTFDSFVHIWSRVPFLMFFKNSVVFAFGVTLLSLLFDSMAAYAFARLKFRGRNGLFVLILIALMLPVQVTMIPLFIMLNDWGWVDTYAGLIIPRATNAFGIFMLRQFFIGLPGELDEAARIDGSSELRLFARIILPLAKPAIASLFVFHLMYNWNDLMWPLIITNSQAMRPLPAGLALFMGQHVVEYGILTAGATIALAPLVIAFLTAQKYFIQGVAFTGLKE